MINPEWEKLKEGEYLRPLFDQLPAEEIKVGPPPLIPPPGVNWNGRVIRSAMDFLPEFQEFLDHKKKA